MELVKDLLFITAAGVGLTMFVVSSMDMARRFSEADFAFMVLGSSIFIGCLHALFG